MNDNGPCYPIHFQTQYHNQITSGWKEECTFCVLGQSFNQSCGTKLSVCAPSLQGGKNLLTLCVNKIWRLLAERNIWFFNRRVFSLTVFVGNHTIFNKAMLFRVWSASYLKNTRLSIESQNVLFHERLETPMAALLQLWDRFYGHFARPSDFLKIV